MYTGVAERLRKTCGLESKSDSSCLERWDESSKTQMYGER